MCHIARSEQSKDQAGASISLLNIDAEIYTACIWDKNNVMKNTMNKNSNLVYNRK